MSGSVRLHRAEAPVKLGFFVIVVSSSRFKMRDAGKRNVSDPSGDLIVDLLAKAGHRIISRVLVPDNKTMIANNVRNGLSLSDVDCVILCGGTGIAKSDVTIETVSSMFEKELPGFGELFRRLSFDTIDSAAILSRATAGVTHGKAIFCLPGSPDAVRLCLERLILPEAGHIVKHARE